MKGEERDVREGDEKVVKIEGREMVKLVEGLEVEEKVVVREKEVNSDIN